MTYDDSTKTSNKLDEMRDKSSKSKVWIRIIFGIPTLMIISYYLSKQSTFSNNNTHQLCQDPSSLSYPPDGIDPLLGDQVRTVTINENGDNKISVEGIEGEFNEVCFKTNFSKMRELRVSVGDLGMWPSLKLFTMSQYGELLKWFRTNHNTDPGAMVEGEN